MYSPPRRLEAKLPEAFKMTNATISLLGRRKLRWLRRQVSLLKVWTKASSVSKSCIIQISNRIKCLRVKHSSAWKQLQFPSYNLAETLCFAFCRCTLCKQAASPLLLILVFSPFVCLDGPFIQNCPISPYVFRDPTITICFCVL